MKRYQYFSPSYKNKLFGTVGAGLPVAQRQCQSPEAYMTNKI